MSKIMTLRILLGAVLAIYSSPVANAGFLSTNSDPYFAAGNWTPTTNGGDGSGTITADAMTLVSNNASGANKYVRYSITIPANIETLSFRYQWSTDDHNASLDLPSYIIGSTTTFICGLTVRSCTGTITNLDLSSKVGQQFIFDQNSYDGCCGRATLVISEVNGVIYRAPATVYVRQNSNLTFAQSLYASDTLSDPDGQLRKTVDQIMNKYGSLIK